MQQGRQRCQGNSHTLSLSGVANGVVCQGAPHTMKMVTADDWERPYSRTKAAFPAVSCYGYRLLWLQVATATDHPHSMKGLGQGREELVTTNRSRGHPTGHNL